MVLQSTDTSSWLESIPGIKECGDNDACYSLQISYRLGFTTACVFAFHLILTLFGRCLANKALNSFWVFKFAFVIGGAALLMFAPNQFFDKWADVASVLLGWFLVIQMVWVLDFAYSWNDLWLANASEDRAAGNSGNGWYIGLLFFAICFLGGSYTWYGLMFSKYSDEGANIIVLAINITVSSFVGVISCFSPRGGILPASLVILYIAWLSWSTVSIGELGGSNNTRLVIGIALAVIVMIYASCQGDAPLVASSDQKNTEQGDPVSMVEAPAQVSMSDRKSVNKDEEVGSWKSIFLLNSMHLSAACYLMNLTLSWTNSPIGVDSLIPYWVQAASAWTMLVLYAWTVFAPFVCTNREF